MRLAFQTRSMNCLASCSVVASLVLLAGCLVPPPLEEEVETTNQAPRIIVDTLVPHPAIGPVLMNSACSPEVFRANLTDPDVGDTLYWRVFLDYHRDTDRLDRQAYELTLDPNNLTSGRSIQFEVDPNDEKFFLSNSTDGTHSVELLVSDRPFSREAFFPEGRALSADDALVDSFVWPLVIYTDEECESEAEQ